MYFNFKLTLSEPGKIIGEGEKCSSGREIQRAPCEREKNIVPMYFNISSVVEF